MRPRYSLLFPLLLAEPVLATPLATGSDPSIPWGRLFLVLAFCLVLAWAAALFIRRYRQGALANPLKMLAGGAIPGPQRRIVIVETRRASAHGDLCLAECDGQTYLLALTAQGASVLDKRATVSGKTAE